MIIMTIRPKYAKAILYGEKKWEFRKYIGVNIEEGERIIIYASGTLRAIIGEFKAGKVILENPQKLRELIPELTEEYYSFIKGVENCI